jgi:hypothetical protein
MHFVLIENIYLVLHQLGKQRGSVGSEEVLLTEVTRDHGWFLIVETVENVYTPFPHVEIEGNELAFALLLGKLFLPPLCLVPSLLTLGSE